MSMTELHQAILAITGQKTDIVQLPDFVGNALSYLGVLPGAPLTRDQWLMLQRDNVPAKGAPGLAVFGVQPTPLAAVAPEWLGRFVGNRFAPRRPMTSAS
jgi:NADH dehydrogenase